MEQIEDFEFDKRDDLGKGQYAIVYKGRFIEQPDVPIAIKAIAKRDLGKTGDQLKKEIKVLRKLSKLRHENVVALHKCADGPAHIFLVMEYCNGGDLADYLYTNGTLSEETIQHFIVQISRALETMQTMAIVHRDLKPQNILLCYSDRCLNPNYTEITVKLADFGFARFLNDGVMATTFCGSPLYMAPEVIVDQIYDARADLYSIGVIFFQCLTGKPPFLAQTPIQLKTFYERSMELKPNIPEWCSDGLRDLLSRTLKRNAANRMTFDEFFIHPFLKEPLKPTPSKRILENTPVLNQKIIFPKSPSVARTPQASLRNSTQSPLQTKPKAVRRIGSTVGMANPFLEPRNLPKKPETLVRMAEAMEESIEGGFTFLPAPGERRPSVKENPNSSHTSSYSKPRPDPVPVHTQRVTYLKMKANLEESRKPSKPIQKSTLNTETSVDETGPVLGSERKTTLPRPDAYDIDKLTLLSPKFVIRGDGKRLPEKSVSSEDVVDNGNRKSPQPEQKQPDFSNLPMTDNGNPFMGHQKMSNLHSSRGSQLHSTDDEDDATSLPFASSIPSATSVSQYAPNTNNITRVQAPSFQPESLDQETFLGDQHKQILAKLRFVAELVDTLIHVAEQKDNPLTNALASRRQMLTTGTTTTNTSTPYRRAEQLVVYVRVLHMLSSALLLAQNSVENRVLHPSMAVQQVLNGLNDKYHLCLMRFQELASLGLPSQDPSLAVISAERVIYRHAIDLCQAAALDELFGNPHLCSQRYQTAHMMLHTLAEQASCEKDKDVLRRYKGAVENRLRVLERQGYVASVIV